MSQTIATTTAGSSETATLGGGCFWCLEAVFENLQGVTAVESGYTGGKIAHPTYAQVCNGDTGHAEVVRVAFDPHVISFEEILEVFFSIHDPTTLNRQGNDVGTQYRSAIYYHSPEQRTAAERVIAQLAADKAFGARIVTEVTAAAVFYAAENYHQQYFANNGRQPYCQLVVAPKLAKFYKKFAGRLKK
jgi:peptide-methionine (S)-S-oxide reductase